MPWRKYPQKKGKHGPIYDISPGITVRKNHHGKWAVYLNRGGERRNKTVGSGKEALTKAIKAGEAMASKQSTVREQPEVREVNEAKESAAIPLFEEFSKEWVEGNSGKWDYYTYQRYESMLRLHVWPHKSFKGKKLSEVSKRDVKDFLRDLLKIRSPATVELAHVVLCGVYGEAMDDFEAITENPASRLLAKVLPPKAKRKRSEPDPFDLEERERFLGYADKHCPRPETLMLKVMLFMGFRLGETLAMRLRHLDLTKRLYHVSESFKQYRWGLPKKGKKRFVDVPDFLAKELSQHITRMKKESLKAGKGGEVDLLFPDPQEPNYNPFSQRKLQRLAERVCKGAKLRRRHPHDLRHTYATVLLMAHRSPAYVMEQLGHGSISITVDIYGHWVPGMGREGLDEALLGGEKPVRNPSESAHQVHTK